MFVSFKIQSSIWIWILYSDPVIETMETAFPCSGILFLCFKSLGLDITSVLLNPSNKMAATYPFCDFFLSKNHTNGWFPAIHFESKEFYQFQQNFLLNWKLARIGSFRFLYWWYTYEVVPIYWLALTLDPCPWKLNQYFTTRAPSCTIYITTQQKEGF